MKNTQGQFFICPCGVYGVFVRAVTVFLLCRCSLTSTLQKPCTCFALFSVSGTLHCYRDKNSASAFPPQLPLLHICDPAGVGITAMWRSRIADRYNAPRSVSRVRSGFRDDCVGGLSVFCCHMLSLLSFYSFFASLKAPYRVLRPASAMTTPQGSGLRPTILQGKSSPKNHAKKHYWRLTKKI